MKRKEITDLLATVEPALASNESLSPMFSHYCFDGENLTAYNGASLGIVVPFKAPFKGGVPGKTLDAMLATVSEDELSLTMVPPDKKAPDANGNLEIRAGKSIITLATIVTDDLSAVFKREFLDSQGQSVKVDEDDLLASVSCCLNSLGDDASKVEQSGIYFRRDKDYLVVYGFNNITLSVAEMALAEGGKNKLELPQDGVLLPGVFCKLMVEYLKNAAGKDGDSFSFEVGEHFASMSSGTINAYGTLIQQPVKIDFDRIMDDNFPSSDTKKLTAIPAGLKEALERACVIINTKVDGQLRTEIVVKDGSANLFSRSQRGEVDDLLEMPGHPDVKLAIDPRPLLDALPFFTGEKPGKMLFEPKCVVFNRPGQTYMVAAFQPKDQSNSAKD